VVVNHAVVELLIRIRSRQKQQQPTEEIEEGKQSFPSQEITHANKNQPRDASSQPQLSEAVKRSARRTERRPVAKDVW
jgi:hypothetical protein